MTKKSESLSGLTDDLKETFEKMDVDEEILKLQETADEVAHVATDFIRKYPIQTVLGAAAVGFLIGVLIKRD